MSGANVMTQKPKSREKFTPTNSDPVVYYICP